VVGLETTVHDGSITLLRNALLGNLGVDPVRESPGARLDLAKLDGTRRVVLDDVLEGLVELAIVEEDVRVVVPPVKVALDGFDGLDDTFELLVAGQDDKGGVGTGLGCVGHEAAGHKTLSCFSLILLFSHYRQ